MATVLSVGALWTSNSTGYVYEIVALHPVILVSPIKTYTTRVHDSKILLFKPEEFLTRFTEGTSGTVTPTLNALSVGSPNATVGTAYSSPISGLTSGSAVVLSGPGAAGLAIAGGVITGTPTAAGAVDLIETLAGATGSPRTSSGAVAVAAAAALPVRLASMNHRMSSVFQASASGRTRMVSQSVHPICNRMSDIQFVYTNKNIDSSKPSEVDNTNVVNFQKCSAQIGSTVQPILFSGQRAGVLPLPSVSPVLVSDKMLPSQFGLSEFNFANAGGLIHRAAADVPTGGVWPAILTQYQTFARTYDPTVDTTWDQVDSTSQMTAPTGSAVTGLNVLGPMAIIGTCVVTGQRAIMFLGDSIAVGAGDSDSARLTSLPGTGFMAGAAYGDGTAPIACILIAKVSARSDQYSSSNSFRRWMRQYVTHAAENFYTNDIATTPILTATQMRDSKRIIWADMKAGGVQRILTTNTHPKLAIGHVLTAASYNSTTGVVTYTTDDTSFMTGQPIGIFSVTPAAFAFNGSSNARSDYTVISATQFSLVMATGLTNPTLTGFSVVDDGRRTVVGQVLDAKWAPGASPDQLDALLAAEVGVNIDRLVDIKTTMVDATDTHRYKADGTAYKWMGADGAHPSTTANIAAAVPFRAAILADAVV